MLYSIVAVLVIILDQAVKYWVSNTLFGTDIVKFIPGVISLVNVHNDGAAFSFLSGSGARIPFIVITGVFTLAVIIALATNFISGRIARWSIVLVTAGGLANCIDRIIYGYVQDMFKVELFDFAIFNVADVFITVFAIVFAIAMIFERQEDSDEDEYYDEEEDDTEEPKKREKKERKSLMSRFKKDGSLDEDEPAKAERPAGRKKGKKSQYEEEYEQYKAQRSTRPPVENRTAVRSQTAPVADPFAEWEKANARLDSQRNTSAAARAMGASAPSTQQPARPRPAAQQMDPRFAQQSAQRAPQSEPQRPAAAQPPVQKRPAAPQPNYQRPAQQPQQNFARPAQPQQPAAARPVQQPAAQPSKSASRGDDFDLDDILNEFK